MSFRSMVVLTGAGISAESGIPTFRASDGLWCGHRVEDVATPQGFQRNPDLVHEFYNMRRAQLREVKPNPAHEALAYLATHWEGEFLLVTQNVDDLHDRVEVGKSFRGRYRLRHMHGELKKARCQFCNEISLWESDMRRLSVCPVCGKTGGMRPHIVWFEEMPLYMDEIREVLLRCDLFISIGTSGNVYPAAGFVEMARHGAGAHTVELNLEPSLGRSFFHERIYGPASQVVPQYVERMIAGTAEPENRCS